MSDELEGALVPIRDKQGKVTGLLDRATADYLASQAPDPTQQSVDALLAEVTRVRVVPVTNFLRGATEENVLLDISEPEAITSFRECFAIIEDPATFGHCMCFGNPHIELYAGERLLATIGYHHGFAIRWDAWKHDAQLKEPERLLDWMSAHGVLGPRQEVEEAEQQAQERAQRIERWLAAMPEGLRPFWEQMHHSHDPALHRALLDALRQAYPTASAQVQVLFEWFGSGAGPWSGYPSYESVVEQLLLHYPTQLLVEAIQAAATTERQWLGAARYFGGWEFWKQKKEDRQLIPPALRERLLEAARKTGIADNIERARRTFGG